MHDWYRFRLLCSETACSLQTHTFGDFQCSPPGSALGKPPGKLDVAFIDTNRPGKNRARSGRITTRQAQMMLTSISIPDHNAISSTGPIDVFS